MHYPQLLEIQFTFNEVHFPANDGDLDLWLPRSQSSDRRDGASLDGEVVVLLPRLIVFSALSSLCPIFIPQPPQLWM